MQWKNTLVIDTRILTDDLVNDLNELVGQCKNDHAKMKDDTEKLAYRRAIAKSGTFWRSIIMSISRNYLSLSNRVGRYWERNLVSPCQRKVWMHTIGWFKLWAFTEQHLRDWRKPSLSWNRSKSITCSLNRAWCFLTGTSSWRTLLDLRIRLSTFLQRTSAASCRNNKLFKSINARGRKCK